MSFYEKLQQADAPTPFYAYDTELLSRTCAAAKEAFSRPDFRLHYAVKANNVPALLQTIAGYGLGADTVSGGEISQAIKAGFDPADIVFAGVGKTDAEIVYALGAGIGWFNVESIEELEVIAQLAAEHKIMARAALRFNPDIDAHTHEYITTGLAENKFGIDPAHLLYAVELAQRSPYVQLVGLHCHIGSQITVTEPFRVLCERILRVAESLGGAAVVPNLSLGGGFGIDYDNPLENPIANFGLFADIFNECLPADKGYTYHFEPGRSIVAQCGALVASVLYVKRGINRQFAILDAGMTDLIRPALYGARHAIVDLTPHGTDTEVYDVVGPVCESSDVFATDVTLPVLQRSDRVAILSAGAYGQSMASTYNSRPLPQAVLL